MARELTPASPRPAPRQVSPGWAFDWLVALIVAGAAGFVAARGTAWAIPLALAPVALVAAGKYRMAMLWVASLEMTLGGWGHALTIADLPIRHLLLAAVMGTWVMVKVVHRDFRIRGGIHAATAWLFIGAVTVAILVSLANGNPYVWEDGPTPFFLLLLFPLADVAARPDGPRTLLQMFMVSIGLLAAVQVALSVAVFIGMIDGNWLYIVFKDRFGGVTPIAGPFWRVFMVGSIYFQIGILILAAGWLADRPVFGRRRDLALLGLIGTSLLFTYTRGFWATAIIGFGVLAWLTTTSGRVRWAATALAGVLVLVLLIPLADAALVDVVGQRIMKTFDPDRDVSVALRLDLYPRVFAQVLQRPILGYGFGRPVEGQLYYENSYLYYAVKAGLVGIVVLAISWVLLLWDGVRQARHHPDAATRAHAAGLTAAAVSMLLVTYINPFINSPVGLYFQAITAALLYGWSRQARIARPAAAAPAPHDAAATDATA